MGRGGREIASFSRSLAGLWLFPPSHTPLSRVWKQHPALPNPILIFCLMSTRLLGAPLEERGRSKSRLHGAHKAPGPWHLLFLGSLEVSCNLQLMWWTVSHLLATLTECLLAPEHSSQTRALSPDLEAHSMQWEPAQRLTHKRAWRSIGPSIKWG